MDKETWNVRGFLDLLFNCLLGFVFLFVISFLMVEVEKKKKGIQTMAEFVITVTWDINNSDDVDSWLRDPTGNLTWFRIKESGLVHLDRDDLGSSNDTFVLPDGTEIRYPYNQEITTIRGFIPGQWVFNVHMYKKNERDRDANVEVKMEKLNPKMETVFIKHLTLGKQGEEITAARFEMSAAGEILDIDDLATSLVSQQLATPNSYGGH